MSGMMDGVSKLWVVEIQGQGLSIQGYKDEFEAAKWLLYRRGFEIGHEELKARIRELVEEVYSQLDRDLVAKKD